MAKSTTSSRRVPWKRANPRKKAGKPAKSLSPRQKAAAKTRAQRAGRRYPNLVDNMREASGGAGKTRKTATKRRGAAKTSKRREQDPDGGLTAAGRKRFADQQGAHLRPGVKKKVSDMTPQEMRRKGSWAVRFYGRTPLPPLVDARGRPTRFALSAHAWGEPVPKTAAAARRIAARGRRLLARYERGRKRGAGRT